MVAGLQGAGKAGAMKMIEEERREEEEYLRKEEQFRRDMIFRLFK